VESVQCVCRHSHILAARVAQVTIHGLPFELIKNPCLSCLLSLIISL
jgi:hypothetical protein